ncbi:SPFH domain-containing protein [Paenibacillus lutrae]|uniref:SPFH domain-containing protein n=1 Tax=Paenibacillus lutrae TaxID=2078573 RepID=A0A7X3FL50_9BACL|nr:SPFH domain-containing protein [Paenibacillus lutrae]MVP01741.1 SPFH domain-containing protein [Paenibacillus lutrae]
MKERNVWKLNGFIGVLAVLALLAAGAYLLIAEMIIPAVILFVLALIPISGFTVVQPNQGMIVNFFGRYSGTIRDSGFWITIPFTERKKISLRVRNFNSVKLKVNDVDGNPIEIASVVVFRVVDTAKAMFEVDNYQTFVEIQSETGLRHVASKYPYDSYNGEAYSLRANTEEIAEELTHELERRLNVAGVEVLESRLTHLAYSTEIASAMLQRQQASAIISAREKIVEGAVSMVQMAISRLQAEGVVELDEERKAAMINNLLVAVVSDRSAQPVINSGSIY